MRKVGEILNTVFGIGILLVLIAGGLSVIGYIIALIIGGETAVTLCAFIYKTYLPWVIKITSVITGVGLIGMYFSHTKALTISAKK